MRPSRSSRSSRPARPSRSSRSSGAAAASRASGASRASRAPGASRAARSQAAPYFPPLEEFRRLASPGSVIPVYREILADLETPVSAYMKLGRAPNTYLLESVEEANKWGRYSIIGLGASVSLSARDGEATIRRGKSVERLRVKRDPLALLESLLGEYRLPAVDGLPAFPGGAVGFVSYDLVRFLEKIPKRARNDMILPDCVFLISDRFLVFDNLKHTVKVIALARPDGKRGAAAAHAEAARRIEATIADLRAPVPIARPRRGASAPAAAARARGGAPSAAASSRAAPAAPRYRSSIGRAGYLERVARAKDYIREGDAFQIVLAHRMQTKVTCDPFDIYRALRVINPSPYMYYLDFGDFQIAGSSPEVLVREVGGRVEVRPIAGTRARGADEEEDRALETELAQDEKERAEHVMLVDLGRNDVGRVSRFGTVQTTEFMRLERYSHVMHLVSHVVGEARRGVSPYDVLRACFPAGTVSGAPKIRAMEIIEELEPVRRGIYAGAIGYFGFSGSMDMCISIRTVLVKDGQAYVGLGAGIVADSDPAREWEETLEKGGALFRAIEMAEGGID